jgi:acetoin utilization deacetylase AcuC-like enzyme
MRNSKIKVFYQPLMVMDAKIHESYSKSPLKPRLLVEKLEKEDLIPEHFIIESAFESFSNKDFLVAHTEQYVADFFTGNKPGCNSNGIPWSLQLCESVKYTNSSLYNAIKYAVENPDTITLSPTSGFHHATPNGGSGFCTFSGQVIASVKLYREKGIRGVYFDLDQHQGNSIEDSRKFVPELNDAIPQYANFNPRGYGREYIENLIKYLATIEEKIISNEIHYLVWCHGADSHKWDDLGGRVNTREWIECASVFYKWLKNLEQKIQRPIPLSMALFGGYRADDYNSVLSLHIADLVECLNVMLDKNLTYSPEVKPKSIVKSL